MSLAACWLRAGVPTRAETVLDELRKKGSRPRIAAKEVPLFTDSANALEWLTANIGAPPEAITAKVAEWAVHRGNPARNAVSSGGSPLLSTLRWQQTLGAEAKTNAASEVMSRQLMDANQIDLPAETPLAVSANRGGSFTALGCGSRSSNRQADLGISNLGQRELYTAAASHESPDGHDVDHHARATFDAKYIGK